MPHSGTDDPTCSPPASGEEDAIVAIQSEEELATPSRSSLPVKEGNVFRDGVRPVDFILIYELQNKERKAWRSTFENNLLEQGLKIEYDFLEKADRPVQSSFNEHNKRPDDCDGFSNKSGVVFVKIHAPWEVLCKWAELSRMRKPIALNNVFAGKEKPNRCSAWMNSCSLNSENLTNRGYMFDTHEHDRGYFTASFDRSRMEKFLIEDKDKFFSRAERFRLVYSILTLTRYGNESKVGIYKLKVGKAYTAAYPPHDGAWRPPKQTKEPVDRVMLNDRQTLYWTWGRAGAWMHYQPLELIRRYFGEKIGVYFAWLGFYTQMLIPASILGLLAFFYGLATLSQDQVQQQVCASNITLCPACDSCHFLPMNHSCMYSQISYVFDNNFTVAFSFLMALWATFFLEFWKRLRSQLSYLWDTNDISQEEGLVRPEFETLADKKKLNPVTEKEEPYLSTTKRAKRLSASFATLLFMLLLVMAALFGIIVYRTILSEIAYITLPAGIIQKNSRLIISTTASLVNFIIITIMDVLYQKLALKLTNMEAPRTQDEFEDSYTLKMFLFQAVNYYSSTCYAAFFRGRFVGTPKAYTRLGGYRQEQCDPAGCFIEVFINLAIVMVLKQALNNAKEIFFPLMKNWWKKRQAKKSEVKVEGKDDVVVSQADESRNLNKLIDEATFRDYTLEPFDELGLFSEYLEMVIQYGFVTLFATAFPLGPLFALLNNLIEIRLDAYKFVTQYQRVVPERSKDIGMWFSILEGISIIAVLSNGLIIGITSNFIEKAVYFALYSPCVANPNYQGGCLDGFKASTLISIKVEQIDRLPTPYNSSYPNVPSTCWYQTTDPTQHFTGSVNHWHIYAGVFIFLFVFENVIFGLKVLMDLMIPDIPGSLVIQSRRQRLLETRMFYAQDQTNNRAVKSADETQPLLVEKDKDASSDAEPEINEQETSVV